MVCRASFSVPAPFSSSVQSYCVVFCAMTLLCCYASSSATVLIWLLGISVHLPGDHRQSLYCLLFYGSSDGRGAMIYLGQPRA